ncbi:MAG: hypothetical protein Q4F99_05405 [bacterium]|nr:hypothetical protein [bacterium]
MGGRGTYASGNTNTPFLYKKVGIFHGVKVLEGIGSLHNLPEESHASAAYAKLFKDGSLQMLRFYDQDRYLTLEIGFHCEPKLTGHNNPVYHIHEYTRNFERSPARLLRADEVEKYRKFLTLKGHLK